MRILIIILTLVFTVNTAKSQLSGQAKIDSLLAELPKAKQDTNHVNLLEQLSFQLYSINPDKGIEYGLQGVKLAKDINWKLGEAKCYHSIAANYIGKSDYPKSLEYFHKALEINNKINDKTNQAGNLGGIGLIYFYQSNYPLALEYYHKALKISEEINDKASIAIVLGNIGNVYSQQIDYPKALEYYIKALNNYQELGNENAAVASINNIGLIYLKQSDYSKALEYFNKAKTINEKPSGNKIWLAANLVNIGLIYQFQSTYPKALEYYHKALKIEEELGNKSGIALNLGNIGRLYYRLSQDSVSINPSELNQFTSLNKEINLNRSIDYTLQSIKIYEEIGELHARSTYLKNLSEAYKQKGNSDKAFEALQEHMKLKDSVFNMDKQKEFANLEAKRENELKDKEIVILQTEKKAQQFQSYLLGGGVIVLFGAFGIAFIRFREKKKLSDKLALQNTEIESQKSLLEEKSDEIYASIRYASTIQNAILPWDATLAKAFSDFMIFYKPKDIVSGDSYWFKAVDGVKFLAVIDCTGHGIPGSMLTVIASSVLDDAVLGKRLKNTGDILTYMNDKVTEVLNQRLKENEVRDGMEVSLIAIHQHKIQFSGAGRPLYLKNGSFEILKTDRRGIAGRAEDDSYIYTSLDIERSDKLLLYLTTDGFADQMNEEGKKYSTRRFVALLESISEKPLSDQFEILNSELTAHQGYKHQIDDITIIGVKI